MPSFNRVVLLGNLTRDIELRHTTGGTAVCDIGLAVNDKVKRGGDWVDEATFVDCTAFGRTAEVASEYLSKGSPVLLEGRLKYESWEGNDGQRRSKLKVIVERLQLLGSKPKDGAANRKEAPSEPEVDPHSQFDDDCPF